MMKLTLILSLVAVCLLVPVSAGENDYYRLLKADGGNDADSNDDVNGGTATSAPTCFSEVSTVQVLARGALAMKDLQVGDQILTKSGKFLPVYAFGHREPDVKARFVQLHTPTMERPLEVTGEHLVYLQNKANPVRADSIQVGDHLLRPTESPLSGKVIKIATVERTGLYAPLTLEGSLVVNGVAASSYISFQKDGGGVVPGLSDHDFVHLVLSPFRMLCHGVSSSICHELDEETGMPYYVSQGIKLVMWGKEQPALISALVFLCIMVLTGLCFLLELAFGPTMAPLMMLTIGALYGIGTKMGLSIRMVKTV